MGERKNLFNIPAYLKIGNKRFKIIKWGVEGAVVENRPVIKRGEPFTADFIFPYDAYNELIIPDVKLKCEAENGTLFCRFEELSEDQKNAFKFLTREYLWRRIISIPSEFMNYTQDSEVRKELLALQRSVSLKRKFKKVAIVFVFLGAAAVILLGIRLITGEKPSGLTVKYSEVKKEKTTRRVEKTDSSSKLAELAKTDHEITKNGKSRLEEKESQTETAEEQKTEKPEQPEKAEKRTENTTDGKGKKEKIHQTVEIPVPSRVKKGETLSRKINYYCVQVATDISPGKLIELAKDLKGFPYVRVERIGKLYTLRVGFDRSFKEDKKLAELLKERVHRRVFPRVCAYRPERWVYPQAEER